MHLSYGGLCLNYFLKSPEDTSRAAMLSPFGLLAENVFCSLVFSQDSVLEMLMASSIS